MRWWRAPSEPVSQPWAVEQPSNVYLLEVLLVLSMLALMGTVAFKQIREPQKFLEACGVSVRKVQRTMKEIDRKTFHLCTLLFPLIHQALLWFRWTNDDCVQLCWALTIAGWTADLSRVYGPDFVRRNWPMQQLLREKEKDKLSGSPFLALGCTLTTAISPPSITMAAVLFLVLGDLSAAIVGVSFGKETVSLKLGREGKKSAEGSVAMLVVCFIVGCTIFAKVELREYPVAIGAIVATLTELIEPCASPAAPRTQAERQARTPRAASHVPASPCSFGLNDNLTIPVFSSIALQFGFARISTCSVAAGGGTALLKDLVTSLTRSQ